jgi:hypothetical protein
VTILNVWVSPDRALVGCDTGLIENGRHVEVNKMAAIPSMGAVVAVSGTRLFQHHVEWCVFDVRGGFDELLAAMPTLLRHAWRTSAEAAGATPGMPALPEANSVLVVGFSARQGRVLGRWHHQWTAAQGFGDPLEIDEGAINMPGPSTGWPQIKLPAPTTVEEMIAYMRVQVKLTNETIRKEIPDAYAGGRLIVAEITREGMTIRAVGEL